MKALTVRHPWALLIARGVKTVENRMQGTGYRGPLAIHASQTIDHVALQLPDVRQALSLCVDGNPEPDHFERVQAIKSEMDATRGRVVAVAELAGCHVADGYCCEPWGWWHAPDSGQTLRHLVLADVQQLEQPRPATGRLGLWDLPFALPIPRRERNREETA